MFVKLPLVSKHSIMLLLSILMLAIGPLQVAAQPTFTFTTIDYPGAVLTRAFGINDRGQIVGNYRNSSGNTHSFLLKEGNFINIDLPGALSTRARAINNRGEIAGTYVDTSFNTLGFLLRNGVVTTLTVPGSVSTSLFGINNNGEVVGFFDAGDGIAQGFKYSQGTYSTVTAPGGTFSQDVLRIDINDAGTIIGSFDIDSVGTVYGFVLGNDSVSTITLKGAPFTSPAGINDAGQIAGSYAFEAGVGHGFLFSKWVFTACDFPGAASTGVAAINSRGVIVGTYTDAGGNFHGMSASPNRDDD